LIGYYIFLILLAICSLSFSFAYASAPENSVLRRLKLPEAGNIFVYAGLVAIVMLSIHLYFIQRFTIPSKSMLPNLVVGDTLSVRPSYFGVVNPFTLSKITHSNNKPEYGQIVIARFPYSADVQYVKRVAALPGDVITINEFGIELNGLFLPYKPLEPEQNDGATHFLSFGEKSYRVIIDPDKPFSNLSNYKVPAGEVFLLGDNITGSVDSRELGSFKIENLLAIER
jgi:signal peptidase I